jgi:hypothetical protein
MANNATKLPPIKFCRANIRSVAEHFSRRVPTTSTRIQATRFAQNLLPFCHCGWQPSYVRPTNLRKVLSPASPLVIQRRNRETGSRI